MKSFFILTLGGAVILGSVGLLFAFRTLNQGGLAYLAVCTAVGIFFGAKFGAIGWAILAGVRLLSGIIDRVEAK